MSLVSSTQKGIRTRGPQPRKHSSRDEKNVMTPDSWRHQQCSDWPGKWNLPQANQHASILDVPFKVPPDSVLVFSSLAIMV